MMKSLRHYTLMLLIIALLTVAPLTAGAAATSSVSIKTQVVSLKFDGQSLSLPDGQYAFIYQNRTYIPIRFISYALQKSVKWDQKTSKVTVSEPTALEKEALAKLLAGAAAGGQQPAAGKSIAIKPVQATLVFDGQPKALPAGQSLYSINNNIYVPLRFMSEAVGTDIKWDQKTSSITGESEAYKAAQAGGGTIPGGNTGGGTGGTDPVGEVKPTYEELAASAEAKFTALESQCQATLTTLYYQHKAATDETVKKNLEDSGKQTIAQCTADFNKLAADTQAELTKFGYSSEELIAKFTKQFNDDMALINSLAGGMLD